MGNKFNGWNRYNAPGSMQKMPPGRNKFGNKKVTVMTEAGPIKFDSKREYNRYVQLQWRESIREITDLRRQVSYALSVNDVKVCDYIADFVYYEGGMLIVEDAKGFRTKDYQLKKKLMWACHSIKILET